MKRHVLLTTATLALVSANQAHAVADAGKSSSSAGTPSVATSGFSPEQLAPARVARWKTLQQAIFPGRRIQDGGGVVRIDAPPRALDAALVPVSLDFPGDQPIKGVYLIIDDNPAPLAAHFTFGPTADARALKVRVRVDAYTNLHAVAEARDGTLYAATRFVKAAGGCSAPAGPDDAAAMQEMGLMKLRLLGAYSPGRPLQAQLMIRHPNFNGMQMNQLTRMYTSARFIRSIDATYEGSSIFHLDSDISLSTDPVITFGFVPASKGSIHVVARDSANATFEHSFDVPGEGAASDLASGS